MTTWWNGLWGWHIQKWRPWFQCQAAGKLKGFAASPWRSSPIHQLLNWCNQIIWGCAANLRKISLTFWPYDGLTNCQAIPLPLQARSNGSRTKLLAQPLESSAISIVPLRSYLFTLKVCKQQVWERLGSAYFWINCASILTAATSFTTTPSP